MTLWLIFAAMLGAIIGSVLNMIIYRYPLMLKARWQEECAEFFNQPLQPPPQKLSLFFPRSHCTQCNKTLPFYCNIPVLSYLFLRGKCFFCREKIPARYLIVELVSTCLTTFVIWQFGLTLQAMMALILTWGLITLSWIDLSHHILPDHLTLPLLWLGLFCASKSLFITAEQAIIGAILGYLFLWVIAVGYKAIKNKDGMGYGDCKMLAMFGAWIGPLPLLNVILIASLTACLVALISLFLKNNKVSGQQLIPFGPYLALGGWCTLMYGPQLTDLTSRLVS